MTYAWFTRRIGTPFSWKGPVTSSRPEGSCFRNTTRLPLKRPASRMSTVPGVMLARSFVGLSVLRRCFGAFTSSAGYIRGSLAAAGAGFSCLACVGKFPPFFFLIAQAPRFLYDLLRDTPSGVGAIAAAASAQPQARTAGFAKETDGGRVFATLTADWK